MVIKEYYTTRKDGIKLNRFYSDKGLKIKQNETGNIYDEAIDIEEAKYSYIETDEKIEEVMEN